ncbi:hypothetical protein FXW07_04350 [Methanosarcina sp. DH1]|nr:hypothetical protein [Methanosarcina sp. DH1]MCC4765871.1 hypothetical protein [Methanosarcina sp. DH1]
MDAENTRYFPKQGPQQRYSGKYEKYGKYGKYEMYGKYGKYEKLKIQEK